MLLEEASAIFPLLDRLGVGLSEQPAIWDLWRRWDSNPGPRDSKKKIKKKKSEKITMTDTGFEPRTLSFGSLFLDSCVSRIYLILQNFSWEQRAFREICLWLCLPRPVILLDHKNISWSLLLRQQEYFTSLVKIDINPNFKTSKTSTLVFSIFCLST